MNGENLGDDPVHVTGVVASCYVDVNSIYVWPDCIDLPNLRLNSFPEDLLVAIILVEDGPRFCLTESGVDEVPDVGEVSVRAASPTTLYPFPARTAMLNETPHRLGWVVIVTEALLSPHEFRHMKIGHRSVCHPAITSPVPWGFDLGLTRLPDSFDGPIEGVLDQLIPVVLLLPEPLHLTAKVVEFLVLERDLKSALTLLQSLIDQFLDVVGLLELLMGVGGARFVEAVLRGCADRRVANVSTSDEEPI